MNLDELTLKACGLTSRDLIDCGGDGLLAPQAAQALVSLRARAKRAGFCLAVASSFRSYSRQLAIFNAKARGQRLVTDERDRPIERTRVSEEQYLHAILRFSALPGTSRHHWGTDLDVWDSAAVANDYALQLSVAEYGHSGPFYDFAMWLQEKALQDDAEGFYLPYLEDSGGVAPEPWHLSYRPGTIGLRERQTADVLDALWATDLAQPLDSVIEEPLELIHIVRPHIDSLLFRYVVT